MKLFIFLDPLEDTAEMKSLTNLQKKNWKKLIILPALCKNQTIILMSWSRFGKRRKILDYWSADCYNQRRRRASFTGTKFGGGGKKLESESEGGQKILTPK